MPPLPKNIFPKLHKMLTSFFMLSESLTFIHSFNKQYWKLSICQVYVKYMKVYESFTYVKYSYSFTDQINLD